MRLVLASASPRRRELLESMDLSFSISSAAGDGPVLSDEPGERVLGHALFKAREVAATCPKQWVLAADTLVFGGEEFFPKPLDRAHARVMLEQLVALGEHQVWTGCCLIGPDGQEFGHCDAARVRFLPIPADELSSYLKGAEWADKAGAYAIQGWAGAYTTLLEGDFDTVVGLSSTAVSTLFQQAGLSPDAFRR